MIFDDDQWFVVKKLRLYYWFNVTVFMYKMLTLCTLRWFEPAYQTKQYICCFYHVDYYHNVMSYVWYYIEYLHSKNNILRAWYKYIHYVYYWSRMKAKMLSLGRQFNDVWPLTTRIRCWPQMSQPHRHRHHFKASLNSKLFILEVFNFQFSKIH